MKKILSLILFLFGILSAGAQNTTISANVIDSDGTQWGNGTWSVKFVPNPSQPNPGIYNINGTPLTPTQLFQSGSLDASGNLPGGIIVPWSNTITPSGSMYFIQVCPNATAPCGGTNFTPATSTLNLTSALTSIIPPPRFNPLSGTYGYTDGEAILQLKPGSTYWNVSSGCQRYFNALTTTWACGAATTNGTVNTGTANHYGYYQAPTNTIQSLNSGYGAWIPDSGSGDPNTNGAVCDLSHAQREYVSIPTLPLLPVTKYICTAEAGPTYVWVPENTLVWNYITVGGSLPGSNTNNACITNGTPNECQWEIPPLATNANNATAWNGVTPTNSPAGTNEACVGQSPSTCTWEVISLPGNRLWSCQPIFGDGINTIAANTYPLVDCFNDTQGTVAFTAVSCFSDNNGTTSVDILKHSTGTTILSGTMTCSNTYASGTLSVLSMASGDWLTFNVTADGTSKYVAVRLSGQY